MINMSLKKQDRTTELVMSIYAKPVPAQSELSNPFSANKRRKKDSLLPKAEKSSPDSLEDWTSRNFVDYYADSYLKMYSAKYKVTYTSDCAYINEIIDFMLDNNLDKNLYTKKFLDWCFLNSHSFSKIANPMLLMNLRRHLNKFYQDVVMSNSQTSLIEILSEIKDLDKMGRSKEIIFKYGIPVASTYFVNFKKVPIEQVESGFTKLFEKLENGTPEEKKLLVSAVQKSISRSPYIPEFLLLDWRDTFPIMQKFSKESWWRESDYPGEPRFQYSKLII